MTDRAVARWRLHAQGLTHPTASTAVQVVGHLLAVQAENPGQSAWAVAARTTAPDATSLASALASGEVVRTHVVRSTWHYVRREDADWLQLLTAPGLRPMYERGLGGTGLTAGDLDRLVATVLELLAQSPDRARPEVADHLREHHPDLADRLDGHAVMYLMAWCELERLVVSGVPRGDGPDGEHTYARWEDRAGPRADLEHFDRDRALAEIVLRYATGHGPVTAKDLAYWATLTLTDVRRGLAAVSDQFSSFELDGRTYWHTGHPPDDVLSGRTEPEGHLLQLLDETYRGYQDSRWVLDQAAIVPRGRETAIGMGLVDGQLVTRMKRTLTRRAQGGSVRFDLQPYRPLEPRELTALEAAAERYGRFLDLEPVVRVTPAG